MGGGGKELYKTNKVCINLLRTCSKNIFVYYVLFLYKRFFSFLSADFSLFCRCFMDSFSLFDLNLALTRNHQSQGAVKLVQTFPAIFLLVLCHQNFLALWSRSRYRSNLKLILFIQTSGTEAKAFIRSEAPLCTRFSFTHLQNMFFFTFNPSKLRLFVE